MIYLAFGTLVFVIAAWAVLYWLLYWLVLLVLSVIYGVDAQPPDIFPLCFAGSASLLCLLGFIAHRFSPHERVLDRKRPWEIALDFLLAIPRSTLSIWGTLTAYQFLDEHEMACAWDLLQFIGRERRVELQAVAREIPDPRTQERVVIALQLVGLVEFRETDAGIRLMLRNAEAERLAQPRVRLDLRHARRRR